VMALTLFEPKLATNTPLVIKYYINRRLTGPKL